MFYEIFFKYDNTWADTEILHLTQIIQRILGIKESLTFKRSANQEVVIALNASCDEAVQQLIDKIYKTVIMIDPYKIQYRRINDEEKIQRAVGTMNKFRITTTSYSEYGGISDTKIIHITAPDKVKALIKALEKYPEIVEEGNINVSFEK